MSHIVLIGICITLLLVMIFIAFRKRYLYVSLSILFIALSISKLIALPDKIDFIWYQSRLEKEYKKCQKEFRVAKNNSDEYTSNYDCGYHSGFVRIKKSWCYICAYTYSQHPYKESFDNNRHFYKVSQTDLDTFKKVLKDHRILSLWNDWYIVTYQTKRGDW